MFYEITASVSSFTLFNSLIFLWFAYYSWWAQISSIPLGLWGKLAFAIRLQKIWSICQHCKIISYPPHIYWETVGPILERIFGFSQPLVNTSIKLCNDWERALFLNSTCQINMNLIFHIFEKFFVSLRINQISNSCSGHKAFKLSDY